MEEYKILIVEDSPTMRQLISFALKRLKNSRIVEASDGVDGLKKLSQDSFNIIITDINMPVMDGLKLVSLVRKDPTYKETPIIIITTEGAQEDKDRAMALGANTYVTKPISGSQVLETVKTYLNIK
ncbi:MAG: response regulator [Deltaproteobacteria bacterium]|nr:response regulator [Deltaproteobacteria bacterium]MCL5792617.1 response regulator [Deltaproteobacteria bacterium]